jgi:multidrug efflux pump
MCLLFAVLGVNVAGQDITVFTQIGLIVLVGLACKNAILIVEFAKQRHEAGDSPARAAVEASRLRLRPILMTSFAFIFGVLPLAISTGPGANSRIAIGTSVIGGMLTASLLAIFYIPLFFVLVRRSTRDALKKVHERLTHSRDGEQPA